MAQKKKQLVAEGKLDKHGRANENTPKEYLRSLPDVAAAKVYTISCYFTVKRHGILFFSDWVCQQVGVASSIPPTDLSCHG